MKIKMLGYLSVAAALCFPNFASGQTSEEWEQMDAAYLACKERFIRDRFGDDNLASQYCYPLVYSHEYSGGDYKGKYPSNPFN